VPLKITFLEAVWFANQPLKIGSISRGGSKALLPLKSIYSGKPFLEADFDRAASTQKRRRL